MTLLLLPFDVKTRIYECRNLIEKLKTVQNKKLPFGILLKKRMEDYKKVLKKINGITK